MGGAYFAPLRTNDDDKGKEVHREGGILFRSVPVNGKRGQGGSFLDRGLVSMKQVVRFLPLSGSG